MPKYRIVEYAHAIMTHYVDADSEEDAIRWVNSGQSDPKYTDLCDYQLDEVEELSDAE